MKKSNNSQTKTSNSKLLNNLKYKKLILKISGEVFGAKSKILHEDAINYIAKQIHDIHQAGAQIGIVVGGGNIIRGRDADWFNKINADVCGMIATIINGIVLRDHLRRRDLQVQLSSAFEVKGIAPCFDIFREQNFYNSGSILIFVGGTGNPLFTTDTAAALRAVELNADILIKATKVEGVYSADPVKNPAAKFFKKLTFSEVIQKNLEVMDLTAFSICRDANMPVCVYNLLKYSLIDIIRGESIGTMITSGG